MPAPHSGRTSCRRRVGVAAALVVAGMLLLGGIAWWGTYVQTTARGYRAAGADGQIVLLGFALWVVPWSLGTMIAGSALQRHRPLVNALLGVGVVLLVAAVVTSIVGAR